LRAGQTTVGLLGLDASLISGSAGS
jgi:hypothetical protein